MAANRYVQTITLIDAANKQDPHQESRNGTAFPKELLYSQRMTAWLEKLQPDAPETVRIAARAQHICRWMIPRDSYPRTRAGYLQWRTRLYSFHADKTAEIMRQTGYDESSIEQVKRMLRKRGLKKEQHPQIIEDIACLVFLESYFADFAADYDEEKIIPIVQKTWKKMSLPAQQAALEMQLPDIAAKLVKKALA